MLRQNWPPMGHSLISAMRNVQVPFQCLHFVGHSCTHKSVQLRMCSRAPRQVEGSESRILTEESGVSRVRPVSNFPTFTVKLIHVELPLQLSNTYQSFCKHGAIHRLFLVPGRSGVLHARNNCSAPNKIFDQLIGQTWSDKSAIITFTLE